MSRYRVDIEPSNPNDSHFQVVQLVGSGHDVLDVGCADGDVGRLLQETGNRVSGLDRDEEAAEKARADLERVVVADLDTSSLLDHFEAASFDVVVLADVLEHLREPERALREATELLREGGRLVLSVPNVAHGALRLALLQGRWTYTEAGLLDRTHLHFFTRTSLLQLLEGVGLAVDDLRATVADPLGVEVELEPDRIPATLVEWVRHQPDALHYQFVLTARRADPDSEPAPRPRVIPAIPLDAVRAQDAYTEQMREQQDLRHRLLTTRDHIIGLEARASAADDRLRWTEGRLRRSRTRANRLQKQVRDMEASTTWRVGRLITSPFRRGR
ncbi:MAG TPA: class I SAM-dependent methyltransferase [Nocardioidaceae bacterium]|nr:class I SAM-dependent methyltransferase [Nocardioidaceae bacterium]